MEPQWNPTVEEQALARIHRMGQTKEVTTVRYVMEGTFEEVRSSCLSRAWADVSQRVVDIQERKKDMAELLFSPGQHQSESENGLDRLRVGSVGGRVTYVRDADDVVVLSLAAALIPAYCLGASLATSQTLSEGRCVSKDHAEFLRRMEALFMSSSSSGTVPKSVPVLLIYPAVNRSPFDRLP